MSDKTEKILYVVKWTNIITRYNHLHLVSLSSLLELQVLSISASQASLQLNFFLYSRPSL